MAHKKVLLYLFLFFTGVFVVPFISSCGKSGGKTIVGSNTQLEILNLSPDLHPVNLYMGYIQVGTSSYSYPYSSGYFYLTTIDTPLQIRSASQRLINLFTLNTALKSNSKYTLFITGLLSDNSDTTIFTNDDTVKKITPGFGKIRFVDASIQNTNLDVSANGTLAFTNIAYKKVTNYVQLPAGNYNFQINPTGSPSTILSTPTLSTTTIQDGRLYTLYTYGIVGRTDTSAFGAGVLINR